MAPATPLASAKEPNAAAAAHLRRRELASRAFARVKSISAALRLLSDITARRNGDMLKNLLY
ncbi:hypothetical protein B1987_13010 [Mycobacterium kansasii]|nr:hypothetical protein B1987_13010 [Mycobacterium kansasii]